MLSYSPNNTAVTITPTATTTYGREGYTYDNLGRTITRTDAGGVVTTWTYDTAPGGSASNGICLGLLASVTTSDTSAEHA